MAEAKSVPVLFTGTIVLPGMVVPIALDDAARAAIDAAQASESGQLLIAPRLDDRYPTHGVIAKILQVGRMAGGEAGVNRAIEILESGVLRTMRLLGVTCLEELSPKHVTQLHRLGPLPPPA